jgi:hypothetical protein
MVSREDSPFGKGWWPQGLKKLHFQDDRVVVIEADGSYNTYEKGINYADAAHDAVVLSSNYNMLYRENMLLPEVVQNAQNKLTARFYQIPASTGTNQAFIIDLGQERTIYQIGLAFPPYWSAFNVWDYVNISTSVDNVDWDDWHQFGSPTLSHPSGDVDPLDSKIKSPVLAEASPRYVRYIKYQLGYPSSNSAHNGSAIYRVYAMGDETRYHNIHEEKWPQLKFDPEQQQYILTEYSGTQSIFNEQGFMIAQKNRQGRTTQLITDSSGHVREIIYPDQSRREFDYNENGLTYVSAK